MKNKILLEAKKAGACSNGYAWWEKHRDFKLLADENPSWYLWGVGHCPSWEQNESVLIACAEKKPWAALAYAAELLPKSVLIACAEKKPRAALTYAAESLPKAVIKKLEEIIK